MAPHRPFIPPVLGCVPAVSRSPTKYSPAYLCSMVHAACNVISLHSTEPTVDIQLSLASYVIFENLFTDLRQEL